LQRKQALVFASQPTATFSSSSFFFVESSDHSKRYALGQHENGLTMPSRLLLFWDRIKEGEKPRFVTVEGLACQQY